MAAPNPVANAESWRRRILREEKLACSAADEHSGISTAPAGATEIFVGSNTLGIPSLRRQPVNTAATAPRDLTKAEYAGHPLTPTASVASKTQRKPNGPAMRRNIIGTIPGHKGSAATFSRVATGTPYRRGATQSSGKISATRPGTSDSCSPSNAPPFNELNIPRRLGAMTPASQCSYPMTPNFSDNGSATSTEVARVMEQLEKLELELRIEQARRAKAEQEVAELQGKQIK